MTKRKKDTDYLYLSARIHCLERHLLTRARMEQMIDAPDAAEAARLLTELGYDSFDASSDAALNKALLHEREKLFQELEGQAESGEIVDVFRLKYDYHNVKTILKDQGNNNRHLLVDAGRFDVANMVQKYRESGKWDFLSPELSTAAAEAQRVLAQTGDSQKSDFILDRAYFAEMSALAEKSRCDYLKNYVAAQIDGANLRSLVRAARMKKDTAFLRSVLFPGGTVKEESLLAAAQNGAVAVPFHHTLLKAAAEEGEKAALGGSLTTFEKLCDDALMHQIAQARRVPFGVEVVIGYLAAKEAEFTAVRIIMSGRMANIPGDVIRERLRESYV